MEIIGTGERDERNYKSGEVKEAKKGKEARKIQRRRVKLVKVTEWEKDGICSRMGDQIRVRGIERERERERAREREVAEVKKTPTLKQREIVERKTKT